MKRHLNTLFVTPEGAYLRKDGAAVEIRHEGATKLRVPLHNLDGIACFGWDTTASASLMRACGEANVSLSVHTPHGKRPGRLDLMEEFCSFMAERAALSLINRQPQWLAVWNASATEV
jgi:CRISPR/Cas system-associated endonuclease Cas1